MQVVEQVASLGVGRADDGADHGPDEQDLRDVADEASEPASRGAESPSGRSFGNLGPRELSVASRPVMIHAVSSVTGFVILDLILSHMN